MATTARARRFASAKLLQLHIMAAHLRMVLCELARLRFDFQQVSNAPIKCAHLLWRCLIDRC